MGFHTVNHKDLEELCALLSREEVAYYLCKNPDFFLHQKEVLVHMHWPLDHHPREDNLVPLHGELIKAARQRIRDLEKICQKLKSQIETDTLVQKRLQECLREITYARNIKEFSMIIRKRLAYLLNMEFSDLILENHGLAARYNDRLQPHFRLSAPNTTSFFLGQSRIKKVYPTAPIPLLFGDQNNIYTTCTVVGLDNGIDFGHNGLKGMLVLGSQTPQVFAADRCDIPLEGLTDIIAISLNKILITEGSWY